MKLTEEQYQAILRRRLTPGTALLLDLPWPPTGNHCYTVARGRKILATQGRNYRDTAVAEIQRQAAGNSVTGSLCIEITAYPPDRRARDLDNLVKLPIDCLKKAGVIADDSHMDRLVVQRARVVKGGQFTISVTTIQDISK